MAQTEVGARGDAGTAALHEVSATAGRPRPTPDRPIGFWAFAGVAVASLGGPLALSRLIVFAVYSLFAIKPPEGSWGTGRPRG